MKVAAEASHSSPCEANDRSTFSGEYSEAMDRTRYRATPFRHGDRLFRKSPVTRTLNDCIPV